jgi:hypothetical protein
VLTIYIAWGKRKQAAILLCFFLAANMMWCINAASVYYQEIKKPSTKAMAQAVRLNLKDDDLAFCYGRYYQDFPVYLGATVGVVGGGGELNFGQAAEKWKKVLMSQDEFWNLWRTSSKRIFLLIPRQLYRGVFTTKDNRHSILGFDKNFIVIMNR